MQVRHQLGQVAVALDNRVGKLARVAGGEAHTLDAGDFVDDAQQGGEVADFAVFHFAAIGVDVLSQEVDFFNALLGKIGDFGQNVVQRAGELFAAGVGDDAERAVFGTAFHDGYECCAAFDAGGRQVVEFFDFGEGNIDLRQAAGFFIYNHFGQTVQRLRAEDDVHIRRAFDDVFAFLGGDAAGNTDDEVGIFFFERAHAA